MGSDVLRAKRNHVLKELLETERIYVSELGSILKVMQCLDYKEINQYLSQKMMCIL